MFYITFALCFAAGIAGTCFLVYTGHPWFAAFVLLVTASLSFRHSSDEKRKDDEPRPEPTP